MNQLKVLNSLIRAGKPSLKLFNNLLLNSDEKTSKIIQKSMNFLDLKPDRIDEVNEMITLAKSEEIVWERFVYIYQNDKLPDENTMCALMDYYVEDLHTVKKIYRQMELGITKNLKAVLDGDSLIDNQQNGIKIEHTKLSRISLLNALIAARDLEGVYEILEEFRMDPSVFSKLQEFKTTDSLNYIKLVADLFDLAKDNGSIDTFQALEPKIQYTVAKQDYKKSSILIQNYLEGRDGVIKSPKMQPIILNYYLKRNEHQKAFELFLDCNPKIKLECIPHLMATLTKLDDNPGSGYSKSEVFEMVQFVWNVYIFLLKSGNSFKEYFRLQRTLQHTLRYFVRAENEEYADKVLFHALNNSVRIDLQLLAEYGAFKLKISGNVWTHLLIPTLAYPQPCLRDDPFKKYENSTLTLESTGLLPEDLYDDNEGFFDFPYVIKPEIEADLIEVLLLTFGMSVNVDYTNSKTKISTSLALKSFYNSVKSSADQKKREGWRYEYLLSPFYESLLGPNGYNLVLETKELYLESVNLQNIYQEYRHDTETKFCGIDRIWTDNRNFECLTVRQLVKTFVETKRQEAMQAMNSKIPVVARPKFHSKPHSQTETVSLIETEKDFLNEKIIFIQNGIELEEIVTDTLKIHEMDNIRDINLYKEKMDTLIQKNNQYPTIGFKMAFRKLVPITKNIVPNFSSSNQTLCDTNSPEMQQLLDAFEALDAPLIMPETTSRFAIVSKQQFQFNPTPPPQEVPKVRTGRRKILNTR